MYLNNKIKAVMKRLNLGGCKILYLLVAVIFVMFFSVQSLDAGKFLSSAHGNSLNGVKRVATGFPTDYPQGHCAHCHEQHATIGGSEPSPTGGPDNYLLFDTNYNETDNFCLECHTGIGSYQTGGSISNYSYSYRAGAWTSGSFDDIEESFSYTSPGTSHNLDNIKTLITSKAWGYTSNSNPCNACHNPHAAQGDPLGSGFKTTTRGWPVSLPSLHSDDNDNNSWGLWGDEAGEKMIDYTATGYQSPYRYNTTNYEPDGTTTDDGSNLTDYVTFCSDCHNSINTIYSDTLSRNLYKFNWTAEKHGGASAVNDGDGTFPITDVIVPYEESSLGAYVLACTDCHEPHGSSNRFLIRKGINGGDSTTSVTVLTTPDNTKDWKSLCEKCHDGSSLPNAHHIVWRDEFGSDYDKCNYCHEPEANDFRNCLLCHYHGNTTIPAVPEYDLPDYGYGEKLF